MAHKTYSPKDVQIALSGIAITGFGEDDFVTLARNSDLMTPTVGADGKLTRTKVADKTGTITLTLAQTARVNHELAALYRAQDALAGDLPVANFTISDHSGSVIAVGINAVLLTLPEESLGNTAGSREWVFHCEFLEWSSIPENLALTLPGFSISNGRLVKA